MQQGRKLPFDEARSLFLTLGRSIDEDVRRGFFDRGNDVFWLQKAPKTGEEFAENLFERLRALGVEFDYRYSGADPQALMHAAVIRTTKKNERKN